jgi:hypothetical protein
VSDRYAELLVDTARTSVALGTRGAAVDERQLVFRHGGLQLDLLLCGGEAAATFVWGQLYRTGSARPCEDAVIALLDEESRTVSETRADAFGEFSFAAPRLVEGAIAVRSGAVRFLCWLSPRPSAARDEGPRA